MGIHFRLYLDVLGFSPLVEVVKIVSPTHPPPNPRKATCGFVDVPKKSNKGLSKIDTPQDNHYGYHTSV